MKKKKSNIQKFVPRKILMVLATCIVIFSYALFFFEKNLFRVIDFLNNYYVNALSESMVSMFLNFLLFCFSVIVVYFLSKKLFIFWIQRQSVDYWQSLSSRKQMNNEHISVYEQNIKKIQEEYAKLSSYMAHEQKNLLAVLRGKMQVSGDTEFIKEVDDVVMAIDDILTMTASEHMIKDQIIDMSLVCASIVDVYVKIYPKITFDFDEDGSYLVRGRELWLERAVTNLVENAVKYGEEGNIIVSLKEERGSVILTVEDEGLGLDDLEKTSIFEMYYRTDGIKKDGYGIGLALVKHVCDLCKGFFWVEKNQEKGSRFYMVFESQNAMKFYEKTQALEQQGGK